MHEKIQHSEDFLRRQTRKYVKSYEQEGSPSALLPPFTFPVAEPKGKLVSADAVQLVCRVPVS